MSAVQETLRPLGVGDIVDRVFAIYRGRPLLFLAISAIPYLILVLTVGGLAIVFAGSFAAVAPLLGGDVQGGFEALAPVLGQLATFVAVVVLVALVTSLVQSAALVAAAAARYLGRDETVGGALATGLRAAGRLFVMGIVAFLTFMALWIGVVVVAATVGEWWSGLIAVCVAVFGSFYLAASWMVSPAVLTLEGLGPIASLARSWRLSAGNRWRILGLIVLLLILQFVLSSLISVLIVASLAADEGVQLSVQQAVNLLTTIAWAPVYWGTFAVLYYDLRVRKEALDLKLAADALARPV